MLFGACIILTLYATRFMIDEVFVATQLLIPLHSAILAGVTAIASIIAYFWAPKKRLFQVALVIFLLFVFTTETLLLASGVTSSPFIALAMLVTIFAGLFGVYGLAPVALATNVFFILDLLVFKTALVTRSQIIIFLLAFELPIIVSWLIWHSQGSGDSDKERAYNALAQELNQVANKSEIVINGIQDGVVAIDSQGVIQLINPAAQKIIGWGKRDALGLDYHSVLKLENNQGKMPEAATNPIEHVLNNNESRLSNNLTIETSSGKKLAISLLASPVGQPGSGAIIVFRDITKAKAEEKQQAEFISTASHEMRTPVASIEGYLGLAINPQTAAIDDRARLYLTKAHEAAQHLGRLFQDLLDVSQAEDGRLRNAPTVIDIVAFTQQLTDEFALKAAEKRLILLFKPSTEHGHTISPVYYAQADSDHLREAVSNLIDNALKYTRQGDVVVDVKGDSEHITISVSDTGIGIPAEDLPHLFQKFYRVDNTDTREIGGTGLGLYLTRRLVEGMNGRIWAESTYKQGSTFFIELPRLSHEEATAKIEASTSSAATSTVPKTAYQAAPASAPAQSVISPVTPAQQSVSPAPQPEIIAAPTVVPAPTIIEQPLQNPQASLPPSKATPQPPTGGHDPRAHLFIPPRK